jgi:Condensation domain
VGVETTYPMTIGQLSVYRDIEDNIPVERRWEANLPFVWDLRQESTVEEVWTALAALAMRHESLRTNYLVDESGALRQYLAAEDPAAVLALLDHDTADVAELEAIEQSTYQKDIDIEHEMPWRAWVLTAGGVPKKLVIVFHHITADGAASLILEDDFHALLAGRELPEAGGQPRTMAENQQGVGAGRLRTAEKYWRRTLDAAPRVTGTPPGTMIGATLHTGIPLELAHEGAAKLDASVATVVLAAFYASLRQVTGQTEMLLFPMSANRFDATTATVVTSLNQWVPLLLSFDGTETFAELAGKMHWKAFNALKNGICDPDAIMTMRGEFFEQADPPVDPGYNFNAILAPPGFSAVVPQEPSSIEYYVPARSTGPGFYLIARGIETIDLIVRTNRPELDQAALTAFLEGMHKNLLEVAGLTAI